MTDIYHIPALLDEAINGLDIKPDGVYVDATFGGGGHSREILKNLGQMGALLSFDQDIDAKANAIDDNRFTFVHSNFRYLKNFLKFYGFDKVDGILTDLGVSSHHFDAASRGFTFREDCALDMRMNPGAAVTAQDIVNKETEEKLTSIFRTYGELDNASRIARRIVQQRAEGPISTTRELCDTVEPLLDRKRQKKELAKVFQAIRIEVNNELGALESLLRQSLDVLKPGGRIAIISYHSLEDRMIKNFFKTGNIEGTTQTDMFGRNLSPFKLLTSKPITPTEQEIETNPRSRSAKLRIARRL